MKSIKLDPNSAKERSKSPIVETRLTQWNIDRQRHKVDLEAQIKSQTDRECTFKPTLVCDPNSIYNNSPTSTFQNRNTKWVDLQKGKKHDLMKKQEEEERREHTFRPKISKKSEILH